MMNQADFLDAVKTHNYSAPVFVQREADYALGEHSHPFDAFALIIQGRFEISIAGKAAVYETGDTFELARDTLHSERCLGGTVVYLSARRSE